MKTLNEHNETIEFERLKSGVLCPKCNKEMMWADSVVLTSCPAKRRVICSNIECKHEGLKTL